MVCGPAGRVAVERVAVLEVRGMVASVVVVLGVVSRKVTLPVAEVLDVRRAVMVPVP